VVCFFVSIYRRRSQTK